MKEYKMKKEGNNLGKIKFSQKDDLIKIIEQDIWRLNTTYLKRLSNIIDKMLREMRYGKNGTR